MTANINNIFCVGRNYRLHAEELGNAVPESPMFFSKPTHALVQMDGQAVILPGNRGEIHYEAELVIAVSRPYERGMRVDELVDRMALGIDFTLRDVQSELKKKGHPWLAAKGFLRSAPISRFIPFPGIEAAVDKEFYLLKNGTEAQRGNIRDMIFDLEQIIDFCAEHYGLDAGDVIFTGTPAGVGAVSDGDRFSLLWGEEELGSCSIKLEG